ncbi:MAG: hypothetical protein ACFCUR_20985 [Rhodomicrobiaceae bacterium]
MAAARSAQHEERNGVFSRPARVGRFAGLIAVILLIWFVILAMAPVIRDVPGQYLVIGPGDARLAAIGATTAALVSSGDGYTHIATSSPKAVGELYAHGAWLVLPASNGGCLRLTDWRRLTGT